MNPYRINFFLNEKEEEIKIIIWQRRICDECKFVAESDSRYDAHLKEPRHVNYYRNLAYMQPKKRQVQGHSSALRPGLG